MLGKPAPADASAVPAARRWAPELCGGPLPRADFASAQGRAQVVQALKSQEPIVLSGAWELLPAARKWAVGKLQEQMTGAKRPCHVLKARRDVQKYTYYFKDLSDRQMPPEALAAVPCNEALNISFDHFLRLARDDARHAYYLQTSLYALDPSKDGQQPLVTSEGLKADLDAAMSNLRWQELTEAMGKPSWLRSQLFVGPVGTLGFGHFDQYDNIFLQVRGTKRILLFDPRSGARGLCPFPVHHPYDQRARVDLEKPDLSAYPRAQGLLGAGAEVLLRPGDALFIPSHWWHHVESTSGSPEWCISVNFWFDCVSPRLLNPPPFLTPALEVELARQVEYLAADALGAAEVPGFLEACAREAAGRLGPPLEEKVLGVLNFALKHLALILGPSALPAFLDDYLHPQRWRGLQPLCF